MEYFQLIKERHSYRGDFKNVEIPRNDLEKILETGILAPSGKNLQTTEFIVVEDSEIIAEAAKILHINKPVQTAKALIFCLIDKNPEDIYYGHNFQIEDCSSAATQMLLAIRNLGYASVWLDGILRREKFEKDLKRLLGVPSTKVIRILLPIGVPVISINEIKGPVKKAITERVSFNKYRFL